MTLYYNGACAVELFAGDELNLLGIMGGFLIRAKNGYTNYSADYMAYKYLTHEDISSFTSDDAKADLMAIMAKVNGDHSNWAECSLADLRCVIGYALRGVDSDGSCTFAELSLAELAIKSHRKLADVIVLAEIKEAARYLNHLSDYELTNSGDISKFVGSQYSYDNNTLAARIDILRLIDKPFPTIQEPEVSEDDAPMDILNYFGVNIPTDADEDYLSAESYSEFLNGYRGAVVDWEAEVRTWLEEIEAAYGVELLLGSF